jgi:hypothetical protein
VRGGWHDLVRLYLFGGGLLVAALMIRSVMVRKSWHRGRRKELACAFGIACLLVADVHYRAGNLGQPWFPDPLGVALTGIGIALIYVWLTGLIQYVPPWRRYGRWRTRHRHRDAR